MMIVNVNALKAGAVVRSPHAFRNFLVAVPSVWRPIQLLQQSVETSPKRLIAAQRTGTFRRSRTAP
jgi:hypothetical protein